MNERTQLIATLAAQFLTPPDSQWTIQGAVKYAADLVKHAEAHVAAENVEKRESAIVCCGGTSSVRDVDGYNWSSL